MAVTLSSTQCAHYRGLPHHQQCCSAAVRTSGHSTFYTIWTPRGAALLSIQQKERLVKPHVAGATATLANSAPPPPSSNVATAAAAAAVPPVLSSPAINIPEPIPGIVSPPKAYDIIVGMGAAKAVLPWQKVLFMGVVAGVYIGIGGLLALTVGGACPGLAASNPGLHKLVYGSFGLPVGLVLVLTMGAELFTGNVACLTAAVVEGKANFRQLAKSWVFSFIGNLIGTLALVGIMLSTGIMATATAPVAAALSKTSLTFIQAFSRGVMCNFMVCLAVWMASASSSFPGKFMAAWMAVSAFTAIGFEHSVANAFMIPMGIAVGAPVSMSKFFMANLLPVTLGNIVGGAALALSYGLIYGALVRSKADLRKQLA